MEEVEQTFVEGMGLAAEEDGMPRVSGQIFGLLILREGALNLDEISTELQVSKASVSTNARLLERTGVIERASRPGDRRDYYRITADAPERSLDRAFERVARTRDLLDTTLAKLSPERETQRARLASMRDWHAFLLGEIERVVARWRRERPVESAPRADESRADAAPADEGEDT